MGSSLTYHDRANSKLQDLKRLIVESVGHEGAARDAKNQEIATLISQFSVTDAMHLLLKSQNPADTDKRSPLEIAVQHGNEFAALAMLGHIEQIGDARLVRTADRFLSQKIDGHNIADDAIAAQMFKLIRKLAKDYPQTSHNISAQGQTGTGKGALDLALQKDSPAVQAQPALHP